MMKMIKKGNGKAHFVDQEATLLGFFDSLEHLSV